MHLQREGKQMIDYLKQGHGDDCASISREKYNWMRKVKKMRLLSSVWPVQVCLATLYLCCQASQKEEEEEEEEDLQMNDALDH